MQKIFLDTNIVIDFLGERKLFYKPAAKIMTLADNKKIRAYTSPSTISTTYYILAKFEGNNAALEKIRKFRLLCDISVMDSKVIDKATSSDFRDFEDAMQYFSALATGCDLIITRNEKDFKRALIPVFNCESYLHTLKKE
jgi:Predicted nucleic acid-binding protein, contains PIN domain